MEEQSKKITPSDLHDLTCIKHDARLEMQRAEAFITGIFMDVKALKRLPERTVADVEEQLLTLEAMARKARDHVDQAMGILSTIPESFAEAERFVSNGEPYKPEDIFGQD